MTVASLFLDAFRFMGNNGPLLLRTSGSLSKLAFTALGIALVIALPLGLWLGHKHRGLFLALSVSTLGRTQPSIALIGVFIAWLGVGFWNVTVALVILGVPPILANGYFAVDGVEPEVVEAARGMGLTEAQILFRVELPLGLPLILAGVRIAAVFVIATATIAAVAGVGGGLGDIIVNQASYRLSGVIGASFCAMALSALVFVALAGLQAGVTPRGIRRTTVERTTPRKEQL